MVRKRSRKYESDDNDSDSDVGFSPDEDSQEPAPKKYSLRQRNRSTNFVPADFDYYGLDAEDGEGANISSDDDFEVEAAPHVRSIKQQRNSRATTPSVTPLYLPEPEVSTTTIDDGLIDFEDVIRADIVVNRNRIDYDNLIQKTEIKLTSPPPCQALPKRRGRRSKKQAEVLHEEPPHTENDTLGLHMLAQLHENDSEALNMVVQPDFNFVKTGSEISADTTQNGNDPTENPEKEVVQDKDVSIVSKAECLSVNIEGEAEPMTKSSPLKEKSSTKLVDEDEDDDVIILEEARDVIVLDD